MGISSKKKALLHVGKQELELTDEEYRHILEEHTGLTSSSDPSFTDEMFKKVIDHFKAVGFWVKRNFEEQHAPNPDNLPTPAQMKVIEHLWEDLAQYVAGAVNRNFQRGFYEKRLRLPAMGPQTRSQANRAIEALKERVQREMRKALRGTG